MNNTITISLNNLHFFSYHGLYPEEKKIGAEFEVNLSVSIHPTNKITELQETINYVKLYDLLKEEMQHPRELLETFVMEVVEKIHLLYPRIKEIVLSITKLQVPAPGFIGNVTAEYSKNFDVKM
ncbi:MAG: dihydroneopterin aldolase [Bacteroidetes bacterium]|nr:dihydroneopterin aldolase [Bacteroidota bacterium]MBS1930033.1 dihydroneopterin aldolase [Bacteroidota bacterium]